MRNRVNNKDELVLNLTALNWEIYSIQYQKLKPVNLPYHSIGAIFKGREDFIKELYETGSTQRYCRDCYSWPWSMGKTRLTVEYAWQHKDHYTALLLYMLRTQTLITNIANFQIHVF
jgi:hypothetical protein